MPLFESLVKPALDSVTSLISEFHLSPEQAAEAREKIRDAEARAQQSALDYDAKLNEIAGENIRAEEQSGDKFTMRARPAVVWMGNALIFWNYGLVPVVGAHWKLAPVTLPDSFWWAWSAIVTGYVFSRSAEKISALPGDSSIQIPLIKIGNKS